MRTISLLAFLSVIIFSCRANTNSVGSSDVVDTKAENVDTTDRPVETKKSNTDYSPAFKGQTRIKGVNTATTYQAVILTKSLKRPWGITVLPDGRFLVTQKAGELVIVSEEGQISSAISGTPAVDDGGQGGLLDVLIEPGFKDRIIYLTFSEDVGEGNLTAVGRATLSADEKTLENFKVIYRATPAYDGHLHFGSRLAIDKERNLFVTTGERSDKVTRPQAQDLNSSLGKVLRLTTEGQAASGNPFKGKSDARAEIYSYGHRNVQGMDIHPQTGEVWVSEMGPRGGDEINLLKAGKNYGWPLITYGIEYSGEKISNGNTKQEGLEQPVYYWDPVLSPGGITFYTGDQIPEWKNNLFVCGLSSQHIARLIIENNKVTGEERLLEKENQRFRDITQGRNGALYAVTDDGRLYRIGK